MKMARRRGRPLSFDPERALERVMRVFWRKGYEGASLTDLTRATGLAAPSLYRTFGNKAALFRQAADRYFAGPLAYLDGAVKLPTSRAVAEHVFTNGAVLFTDRRNPAGCLFVTCVLSSSSLAPAVRRALVARRREKEQRLCERFQAAVAEGDLPTGTDPVALARYLLGMHFGLAVHASTGASRAELMNLVTLALERWPGR